MIPAPILAAFELTSSQKVLAGFVGIVLIGVVLWYARVLDWALAGLSWIMERLVLGGFGIWRRFFAWLPWPALLGLIVAVPFLVWLDGEKHAVFALLIGAVLLIIGISSCLAFFLIDQERYEVARGYKALHNPAKGQEPAHKLLIYGERVGLPLLLTACLASISGFALTNMGLYKSFGSSWYVLGDHLSYQQIYEPEKVRPIENEPAEFTDFLAYSLLNVASAVDLIDLVNYNRWQRIAFVHPGNMISRAFLAVFKLFFTLVLLQQLWSWVRNVRLLSESVRDFWSPHEPIQRRAGESLAQQGAQAVDYLILSMTSAAYLTSEQRSYLPRIALSVGPASVPLLVRHLRNEQEHVREALVGTLGELQAVEALPALVDLAGDPSAAVRQAVGTALGRIFELGVLAVRKHWQLRKSFRHETRWRLWKKAIEKRPDIDPVAIARDVLANLCEDATREVRLEAVKALCQFGPEASSAVPALLRLLGDEDAELKEQLAEALGRIGQPAPHVVAGLMQLLEDSSPQVRRAAARAVSGVGEEAAAASPLLVKLVHDNDETVREVAAEALSRIGELDVRAVPRLVAGLKSRDNLVQAQAADAIGAIGPSAADAVPALVEALREENDRVRTKAAWALGQMGPAAAVAVAPLSAALSDPDFRVAAEAAAALGAIGAAAAPAAASLLKAIDHINSEVRRNAAFAMAQVGVTDEFLAGRLASLANDSELRVRLDALRCMGNLAGGPTVAVECLLSSLADPAPEVRRTAVHSLAQMGLPAETVAPALVLLLDDLDVDVQTETALALGAVESPPADAITALGEALRRDREKLQIAAAKALGQIGEPAVSVIDDLRFALERGSAEVREPVLRAIAQIKPDEAIELCLAALQDPSTEVRQVASAGLVRRASAIPAEALGALAAGLHDPDPQIRANLAQVLAQHENVPVAAALPLLACTADPDDGLRLNALRSLRGMKEHVLAELPRLIEDPNPQVAFTAASYLLTANPTHPQASAILEKAIEASVVRDRRQALEVLESLGENAARFADRLRVQVEREDDDELRERGQALLKAPAASGESAAMATK